MSGSAGLCWEEVEGDILGLGLKNLSINFFIIEVVSEVDTTPLVLSDPVEDSVPELILQGSLLFLR